MGQEKMVGVRQQIPCCQKSLICLQDCRSQPRPNGYRGVVCEAAAEALDTTRSLSACGDCMGKECGCIAGASLDQALADEDPQYSRMEWRLCNLTIPGKALMRMMLRVV